MALRGGATANLVNGEILLMRGDVPTMTEGVGDAANAIAMELIVHRAREPGAGGDRRGDHGVDVLYIEMDANRRSGDGLGAERTYFRVLVRQHQA